MVGESSPVAPALKRGRLVVAASVATVAFAVDLAFAGSAHGWWLGGAAAVAALTAAVWAAADRLRVLLEPRAASVTIGAAAGVVLASLTHLGFLLGSRLDGALPRDVAALYRILLDYPAAALAVPLVTLVALAEEVVWRGVVIELLRPRLHGATLVAVATLLYALPMTAAGNVALVVAGLACGATWTALRLLQGDLIAPLTSHLVWLAALLALWPLR